MCSHGIKGEQVAIIAVCLPQLSGFFTTLAHCRMKTSLLFVKNCNFVFVNRNVQCGKLSDKWWSKIEFLLPLEFVN